MAKKKSRLQMAQTEAQSAIDKTNEKIDELGKNTSMLYNQLTGIQASFDKIRNVPSDKKLEYEKLKTVRLNWKQQAEKIEADYKLAEARNAGAGAAGAGVGVAVVTMGPTVAMGVATTFGVASTGTAISALSGAAATNAALAWLGGGALAAGGGGMAAGEAFLALAGPVGWAIAGVALLTSGVLFFITKSNQKRLENIFTSISNRDIRLYDLAMVELNERITRIIDEAGKLSVAIDTIETFGSDYNVMTEQQQYQLGAYVNLMNSSTQLLVNPILGLQPKYTQEDFNKYIAWQERKTDDSICEKFSTIIISLANFLYKIDLNEQDRKLLWKALRKNKKMLKSMDVSKKEFDMNIFDSIYEALAYKDSLKLSSQNGEYSIEENPFENENNSFLISDSDDFEINFSKNDNQISIPDVEMMKVENSNFMISSVLITQELYESVMGNNPSSEKCSYAPVDSITWWEAIKFCNRLSVLQNKTPVYKRDVVNNLFIDFNANGYRLPTFYERRYTCELANIPHENNMWEWVCNIPKKDDKSLNGNEERCNFRNTVGYQPNGSVTFGCFQAKKRKKSIGFRIVSQLHSGIPKDYKE